MIDVFRRVRSHQINSDGIDRAGVDASLSFIRLGMYPAYYWRDRRELSLSASTVREVIGLGCAAEFNFYSLSAIRDFLYHYEDYVSSIQRGLSQGNLNSEPLGTSGENPELPPLFVAIPFNACGHSHTFSVPAKVVVPSSAIVRNISGRNKSSITIYSVDGDFAVAEAALSEIGRHPGTELDISKVLIPEYIVSAPDLKEWRTEFLELEKRFAAGELLKVVLAHQFRFQNVRSIGLRQLLCSEFPTQIDNRFRFLMASSDSDWIYSRSPERLLSTEGRMLKSEALGGTLRTGENCSNEKLNREHNAIVEQIDHDLRLCGIMPQWEGLDARSLDLGTIQHLWHQVRGELPGSLFKTDLLFALHPTPAVCGLPKESALNVLENFESFDRGLYGGPLGVIHGSSWNFMAGLRTVFSSENYFNIPIGVGIVRGSCPEEELAELYAKLGSL